MIFISFYSELYRKGRWGDQFSGKTETNEFSIGTVYHAPMGLHFHSGVSFGVNNNGYSSISLNNDTEILPNVVSTNSFGNRTQSYQLKGTPDYKFYASVTWTGKVIGLDSDNDKITNRKDRCPNDPEDLDGNQDEDGCPEYDDDGDQIPDSLDLCPRAPEDYDNFQDEDGCPEVDNDKDLIRDSADACPLQPEDLDGFEDMDGCTDADNGR